jgi:hypothetical protein
VRIFRYTPGERLERAVKREYNGNETTPQANDRAKITPIEYLKYGLRVWAYL